MRDPKFVDSLTDFLYGLDLAEEIEFFKIKRGTEMDSKIAGPVTFYSLNNIEPRICVIEDGEKTFYYSDGRFKRNGSKVLDLKGTHKIDFKNSHVDKDGDPINLPKNLNEPAVLQLLTKYSFVDTTSTENSLNLDWIETKNALWNMCRYYNLFSLEDYERDRHRDRYNKADFPTVTNWNNYSTNRNRYIIKFETNTNKNSIERIGKPYLFDVIQLHSSTLCLNELPFKFINKKAALLFIENFQSDLIEVVKGWRMLLSQHSSRIKKR